MGLHMRVLVTGHMGFIGRHLSRYFMGRGWDVTGVDVVAGEDARTWFNSAGMAPFDLVAHCAAVVGGRQVIERSPMQQAVDFELDAGLFRWALEGNAPQVVYFSSSAAYPVDLQRNDEWHRPLMEDDIDLEAPQQPDALYGWSKLTGEVLARHARQAGLEVLVVRPFSGYGTDQGTCYPFPAIMARAAAREDPLTVWGDGQQVRDFVHIDDICAAIGAFLDAEESGPVNIGTGRPTSMEQLARLAARTVGYEPEVKALASEPSGVAYRVADTTEMSRHYVPKVSLEEGIERALRGQL